MENAKLVSFPKVCQEVIRKCAEKIYPLLSINFQGSNLSKPEISRLTQNNIDKSQEILDLYFPSIEGDPVIQIATCLVRYGEQEPYKTHILTLGTCDPIPNVEVVQCETEEELILKWKLLIEDEDVDMYSGYNIYGFDFPYIWDRAEDLGVLKEYKTLSKFQDRESHVQTKVLSSSALGHNTWREIDSIGRIQVDLLKVVQRDHNLNSYKLDNVASTFMQGVITSFNEILNNEGEITHTVLSTNSLKGLQVDGFIKCSYMDGHSCEKHQDGKKFKIIYVHDNGTFEIEGAMGLQDDKQYSWTMAKDDVTPQDIFRLQQEGPSERCIVARYCVKDVVLCVELCQKLEIMANNIGMANVCTVPLSWIFTRGQSIKIFSLISKQCREDNILMPTLYITKKDAVEGAVVLNPKPGIYTKTPVAVLDYGSLYPSSIISENICHTTLITDPQFMGEQGGKRLNKLGYEYVDIQFDSFDIIGNKKIKRGVKICRYKQPKKDKNGNIPIKNRGIIPQILLKVLNARKNTRKKIKYKTVTISDGSKFEGLYNKDKQIIILDDNTEYKVPTDSVVDCKDTYNVFQKAVWDGLQLAYKVTANSIYGQLGASTSPIYWPELASSTTAVGRNLLNLAGNFAIDNYKDKWFGDIYIKDTVLVYGDTDSVFVKYNMEDRDGNPVYNRKALEASIKISLDIEKNVQTKLKFPHKLEYEKTFWPFILFSKKRYAGNKYEFNATKFTQTSMGIVTKRRDNANIVKYAFGGVLDIIMNKLNINNSIDFLQLCIRNIMDGKFDMDKFIVTKSLRAYYKNPQSIAHKVLADRMGERDPGNKPKPNDRIPYAYIVKENIVITNEIMLNLSNANMFGKYIVIYESLEKDKFIIEINSDLKGIKNSQILFKASLDWDWNNEKDKGYNIPFSTEYSLFQKLSEPRRDKLPIITFSDILIHKHKGKVRFPANRNLNKMNCFVYVTKICKKVNETATPKREVIYKYNPCLFSKKNTKIKKKTLQGDRIENPKFIIDNKLPLDYKFYITNQIMKPVCQIFGLIVDTLDRKYKFPYDETYYERKYKALILDGKEEDKAIAKIRDMREKMAQQLLFEPILKQIENKKGLSAWAQFGFFTLPKKPTIIIKN
jgi:DNA polymerase elongation subunit (family B)